MSIGGRLLPLLRGERRRLSYSYFQKVIDGVLCMSGKGRIVARKHFRERRLANKSHQILEKEKLIMKPCPVCGVSLPDQASFCASCGHAFTPAQAQAGRLPGGAGRSEAQAKIEQENRQAFSGSPNAPQPAKIQNVEIHMTPIPL